MKHPRFVLFLLLFFVVLGVVVNLCSAAAAAAAGYGYGTPSGNHGRERPPDPVHRGPRQGHPAPVHPHEAAAAHNGALLRGG